MGWTWEYQSAPGAVVLEEVSQPEGGFPTQADAETWVGEVWPDLLDGGIEAVTLYEEQRLVYGPMSLRPAP